MADQGPSDVKIFSSVRPLQIQRSFESSTDDESIAQVTANVNSATVSQSPDGFSRSTGFSAMSHTVTVQTSSGVSASPASQQYVPVQHSPSAVDAASSSQSRVLISTGSSRSTVQSPIVINAGSTSSTQSRVTISSGGSGSVPTGQVVSPVQHAAPPTPRRASLTIKSAPAATTQSSTPYNPSPANQSPVNATVAAQLADAAADLDESQHFYVEEIEHNARVAVSRPLSWADLMAKLDFDVAMCWVLAVLITTVICILSEDDISFVYVLALISLLSIAAFVRQDHFK